MENKHDYTDIADEILRNAVYDYTGYGNATMPNRDQSYFNREEMIRPFDNVSDKIASIIYTLKIYWRNPAHSEILRAVKQESLLGQAIYLLARKTASFDGFEMKFEVNEKEIPIVFGDLMRVYATAGYDVSLLKSFLVELYEEYYPSHEKDYHEGKDGIKCSHITEEDLDVDIRQNLFEFLNDLILAYRKDMILTRYLYHCPDQDALRENIDRAKSLWLEGICDPVADEILEYEDSSGNAVKYYPIIDTSIIFRMARQKNKEFESLMHEQLEGITSRVIRDCKLFPDSEDFCNAIINTLHWRRAVLKKTDTLMIELMIHHSENIPVPEEFREDDKTINGSLVLLRVSIVGK